jgi:UDP-N-acetylmuramate: L-alanyl-gamma-D-glutamyl-meso-diaminopimelate ligase
MAKYHFIAIGGAVMHQLASHLKQEGHTISGSDDAIFDPAKSNLEKLGLMPEKIGWYTENIMPDTDAIILGMHAKADNPELLRAQELGLKIYSFPEFVFEQCKEKTRIVVAGSHGKTTITSMIMHIFRENGIDFDYLVGAKLDGFDYMVKTSASAKYIVIEGDEYLTSPLDGRSKFLHYHPHIAIISGIAWDHINVFPTFESYLETFSKFMLDIDAHGFLIYNSEDEILKQLVRDTENACTEIPYRSFEFKTVNDESILVYEGREYPVQIFGSHNFSNVRSAFEAARLIRVPEEKILKSIQSFSGAAKRLEKVYDDPEIKFTIYRDFAHAPSKLKATVKAVRERYADRRIIALFELHTYSSLQENFIDQYAHSLDPADIRLLYLDTEALKVKNRSDLDSDWLKRQFADDSIRVYKDAGALKEYIRDQVTENCVLLLMSSGNLGGLQTTDFQ